MKSILITFSGIVLSIALLWIQTPVVTAYSYKKREIKVRTTAYTHSESDHKIYGRKTAIGSQLKFSREYTSAASDWSRFPVGTEFRIKGLNRHFVIDDYGSALLGKDTIDLYFPSRSDMNRWGVQHVDIIVTKYGDYEKSKEILAPRKKYHHCRKMLAEIELNGRNGKSGYEVVPPVPDDIDLKLMAAASIPKSEWSSPSPSLEPDPKQPIPTEEPGVLIAQTEKAPPIRRGTRPFRDLFASSFQTVALWNPGKKHSGEIRIPIKEEIVIPPKTNQIQKNSAPENVYQTVRKVRQFRPIQ